MARIFGMNASKFTDAQEAIVVKQTDYRAPVSDVLLT